MSYLNLKILFFLLLTSQLSSQTILKNTYQIESSKVYLNDIFPTAKQNQLLFTIEAHKYSKRIKSTKFIKFLNAKGYKEITSSSRYIKFQIKSPINTIIINTFLKHHYLNKYKTISINSITVTSRGYIDSLPGKYTVEIRDKSYLSHIGVINIKDQYNKKIFFNYLIEADIKVLKTKELIKRGERLSFSNAKYQTIKFDKFKATPIMNLVNNATQAKHQIKIDKIITIRDIEGLDLVHKNSQVSVSLNNAGIYITFSAKALQNGKLGDIITIQKQDLKRLKAKVIGKKRVELR